MSTLAELTEKYGAAQPVADGLWGVKDLTDWVAKQDYLFAETKQVALDFVMRCLGSSPVVGHPDLIHVVFDPLLATVPPAAVIMGEPMWDRDFLKEAYLRSFEIVYSSSGNEVTPRERTELFTALINFIARASSAVRGSEKPIEQVI